MKDVNVLFVICTIYLPVMMVLLFSPQIADYYTYAVPLNTLVIPTYLPDISKSFQELYDYPHSGCFTTPNGNLFCYSSPSFEGEPRAAYVIGKSGIDGEIHFDPVERGVNYFLMLNMTRVTGEQALITFADKGYKIGGSEYTWYEVTDEFEYSAKIKPYDTFISHCTNYEGTSVTIVQYLGIKEIDGNEYFLTWHTSGDSQTGVVCDYPQIIQHSLNHNFRDL